MTTGATVVCALVGLSLTAVCAAPAGAQVLDIGDDGAVSVLAGPAVYSGPEYPAQSLIGAIGRVPPTTRSLGPRQPAFSHAASSHGVSPQVLEAVAWRESRFDPHAVSPKGARGMMQLMPSTARALGVDPDDPAANLDGGARYLARMMDAFDGDVVLALAAYNAGPGAVKRHAGVPPYPETKAFVDAVLRRLADDVVPGGSP